MTTSEKIELAVAGGTIALAAAAFTQIVLEKWSGPRLTLEPGDRGVHTRLEGHPPRPWIRLLVCNRRGRRTALGTRVLVDRFRRRTILEQPVSLADPELGWPSTDVALGAGAVVFGGTARPLDFGALGAGPRDPGADFPNLMQPVATLPEDYQWWFRFTLAMHAKNLFIGREFLPPDSGGYTATLIVGADEGRARVVDVDFGWAGNVATPDEALRSFWIEVRHPRESLRGRLETGWRRLRWAVRRPQ